MSDEKLKMQADSADAAFPDDRGASRLLVGVKVRGVKQPGGFQGTVRDLRTGGA